MNDEAATEACQFQLYTDQVTFLAPAGQMDCSEPRVQALEEHGIQILEGDVESVLGRPDRLDALRLKDGREIPCDLMFSLYGCRPNVKLALDVGADLTSKGYVRIDNDGYTTVPGLFCAGDVGGIHTHQVASAVHEGAEAAQTANYYLYAGYQKYEMGAAAEEQPRLSPITP
jgi:thioredoxin reductase (NADPH)